MCGDSNLYEWNIPVFRYNLSHWKRTAMFSDPVFEIVGSSFVLFCFFLRQKKHALEKPIPFRNE